MKKLFFLSFFIIIIGACDLHYLIQNKTKVTGNGQVISQQRDIRGINFVEAAESLNVKVTQSDREEVVVEADENIIDLIETDLQNGKLKIHVDDQYQINKAKSKNIYVKVKTLDGLNCNSSASLETTNQIIGQDFDINVSSSGKIVADIEGDEVVCRISSSGKGDFTIKAEETSINVSSSGKANIDIDSREILCEANSSGRLYLAGWSEIITAKVSSSGKIYGDDLIAEECYATASSAGNISITVKTMIDAKASSGGKIAYNGNPETHISTSSGGAINKK